MATVKDKSLLELAIEVLSEYKKPIDLTTIAKATMEKKGLKTEQGKEMMTSFICDFMESGYFVYCENNLWDLKERQSLNVINKEVSDFGKDKDFDDEVKSNELNSDVEETTNDSDDSKEDDTEVAPEEDDIETAINAGTSKAHSLADDNVQLGYDEEDNDDED